MGCSAAACAAGAPEKPGAAEFTESRRVAVGRAVRAPKQCGSMGCAERVLRAVASAAGALECHPGKCITLECRPGEPGLVELVTRSGFPGASSTRAGACYALLLLLGTFGLHKFYLRLNGGGFLYLMLGVVGWVTSWLLVGYLLLIPLC